MLWGETVYFTVKKQGETGLRYVLQKYALHDLLPQERTHLPEFQPPPKIVLPTGHQVDITWGGVHIQNSTRGMLDHNLLI